MSEVVKEETIDKSFELWAKVEEEAHDLAEETIDNVAWRAIRTWEVMEKIASVHRARDNCTCKAEDVWMYIRVRGCKIGCKKCKRRWIMVESFSPEH